MCQADLLGPLEVFRQVDRLALAGQVIKLAAFHGFFDQRFDSSIECHVAILPRNEVLLVIQSSQETLFYAILTFTRSLSLHYGLLCLGNGELYLLGNPVAAPGFARSCQADTVPAL